MPSLAASARSLKAPSFSTCQSIVAEKCGSSACESIPAPHRPVCQKSKQQRLNSVNIRRAGLPRQFSGLQHDIPSCNQLCRLAPSRRRHVQCRAGKEGPASPPYKVVITGSSKGIGLALAKQFLAAGDKVCFCARDADQLEAQCKELEKEYPGQTLSRATDVTKASDVAALAEFVKKEMGNVDIWINNAGTNAYTYKPLVENSDEDIEQIVATNTLGVMLCCRQAIKLMRDQSSRGHVFNMDGAGADGNPTPRFAAYGATKRGLAQFTKSLQAELKLLDIKNVTVHNLSPGMVTTDLLMAGADRQQARFFINALAEPPDVVAEFLVPRIRATVAEADGKSKYIRFLTSPKAYTQILARLLFKSRKDRYVKEADG